MDLRYLQRPRSLLDGESAVARCISYLESLYESVAETLPDIRDDGVVTKLDGGQMPLDDTYADALGQASATGKFLQFGKGKRTRKWKMGLKLHREQHPDVSGKEIRYLPPGVMRDHWEAMKAIDSSRPVSFKTFWSTWHVEYPHLRFRPTSSHAQCSTCIHHKLLLRELANHMAARQKQGQLLAEHLMSQYRDRLAYWALRGTSRLGCSGTICCILDGMDQCKFMYPRSPLMQAKDLATFQRPKLHVTGCLVHGFCLAMVVSHHNHPKDSSLMTEILAILLTRMRSMGIELQKIHLHLQGDNTTRELKNSTLLRFLSAMTSHNIVASASMGMLRSGHTHEDIDQTFGSLALHIVRHCKNAETPGDFSRVIQQWADSAVRPHERHRMVIQVDQHRDW